MSPGSSWPSQDDTLRMRPVGVLSKRLQKQEGSVVEPTMYRLRSSSFSFWKRLRSLRTPALASLTSFPDTPSACSSYTGVSFHGCAYSARLHYLNKAFSGLADLVSSRPLRIHVNNAVDGVAYPPENFVCNEVPALALAVVTAGCGGIISILTLLMALCDRRRGGWNFAVSRREV